MPGRGEYLHGLQRECCAGTMSAANPRLSRIGEGERESDAANAPNRSTSRGSELVGLYSIGTSTASATSYEAGPRGELDRS